MKKFVKAVKAVMLGANIITCLAWARFIMDKSTHCLAEYLEIEEP